MFSNRKGWRLVVLCLMLLLGILRGAAKSEEGLPYWLNSAVSDEVFFREFLNLDYPGMGAVGEAVEREDWGSAKAALLQYFRERKSPELSARIRLDRYRQDVHGLTDHEVAEMALRREIWIRDQWVRFEGPVEWRSPPIPEPHTEFYAHHLNRMYFLQELSAAYLATREEAYADALVSYLLEFIERNPLPVGIDYTYPQPYGWSQISTTYRFMFTWPLALEAIWKSDRLDGETLVRILKSLHQQILFVREHHFTEGNHCTFEVGCLVMAGVYWPEFRGSADWIAHGKEWLQRQAKKEFYLDGFIKEMSPSYHTAYRLLLWPLEFARHNGVDIAFPEDYLETVRRAVRVRMLLQKPDGTVPRFNNSVGRDRRAELLEYGRLFNEPDVMWVATEGREGHEPLVTSWFFPDARYAVMREDWTRSSDYLILDCGPAGTNHVNANGLALELVAEGIPFIENPGYGIIGDNRMFRWRAKDSRSQSTLNPVGMSQIWGADAEGEMVSTPDRDYAVGRYEGGYVRMDEDHRAVGGVEKGMVHIRQVLYEKGAYWLVVDSLVAKDETSTDKPISAAVHWHFRPGPAGYHGSEGYIWSEQKGRRLILDIGFPDQRAVSLLEGSSDPTAGWWSPGTEEGRYTDLPAPEARVVATEKLPLRFFTLISLESPEGAFARIEREALNADTVELIVRRIDGRRDRIRLGDPLKARAKGFSLTLEQIEQ